jgi:hypothetical protein
MAFYGWSFEKAVQELTENFKKEEQAGQRTEGEEEQKFLHINENKDNKRAIAYLCQTRKIGYGLVKKLIEDHYISQDNHGNIIFKIYDEKGDLVGAELCGTLSEVRFKSIAEGTQLGYGFNVSIGEPTKTLFFESPIDLLSFWTLNEKRLTAHRLVSLAGLRVDIFQNILERFCIPPGTAYLCVDNDPAGKAFIKTIQSKYSTIKIYIPTTVKDWNDLLRTM